MPMEKSGCVSDDFLGMGSMQSLEREKWAVRDTENYGKDTGNSIGDISECDRDL